MKFSTILSLLTITLVTTFSSSLKAEEEQSPAMKLIKLMNFSETAKAGASTAFAPVLQQLQGMGLPQEAIEEVKEAADRFFAKTFDNPEIEAEIAKVYEGIYTNEEMLELLKFYNTPVGKKSIEAMPQVMQESAKIGQKYAMQNQAEFQAEMQAIVAKHKPVGAAE